MAMQYDYRKQRSTFKCETTGKWSEREKEREGDSDIEREVHCFKVDHGDCRSIIN